MFISFPGPAQGYGTFLYFLLMSCVQFVSPRAIEIGEKFPDAQVIGVDRNPVLPRFVPQHVLALTSS